MVSHLVSCCVILRRATMKGWEKEMFQKICALGNLKWNQNDIAWNIGKILEKYPKNNCIKSELFQKDFSSIMLKLPGADTAFKIS